MRYEWGDWVRYRRWDQFELLAKRDPTQQLCDTVAELARGMDNKIEIKTLKRILFMLKQQGFEPSDFEHLDPEPPKLPNVGSYGIMMSPDSHGWRTYFYGQVISGEIWALYVVTLERYGIIEVDMLRYSDKVWPTMRTDLLEKHPAPIRAEVEPAYVLHRIRSAYENRGRERHVRLSTFWKHQLQRVPAEFPHPCQNHTIAVGMTPETRLLVMREHEYVNDFRIFIQPDDPIWSEIHTIRWDELLTPEERQAKYLEILLADRHRLCTEFTVQDMVNRFLDITYLMGDPKSKETWVIMHLAEHLQEKRSRSEVFQALLEVTARNLEEDIEEDEDDPAAFPRRD